MKIITFALIVSLLLLQVRADDKRVKLSVYYESLCPDSVDFITGQLSKAFSEVNELMEIELIPFGKAKVNFFITQTSYCKILRFN